MQAVDLKIDVTEAAGLGEEAFIALTVHLPDPEKLLAEPVVCFAKPGGGYYISAPLPAGLSFSNTTGVISGTPTVVGVYAATQSATNAGGYFRRPVSVAA